MNLCKYRNIFGRPNEGVHSFRIFNLAVIDVVFTLLGAYIISLYTKYSFITTSIILFLLGILCHHIFCVDTTIARVLSLNNLTRISLSNVLLSIASFWSNFYKNFYFL